MENYKTKIDFEFPGDDLSIIDVVYEILEKNNLGYYQKDNSKWPQKGDESYAMIIIDTAKTVFKKIIPEDKIIELLQKHLKVSREIAEKVVLDIKQKIIPYVKEVLVDKEGKKVFEKISTQDFILEKIKKNIPLEKSKTFLPEEPLERVKKIEITNVEENSKNLEKEDKGRKDTYREEIE